MDYCTGWFEGWWAHCCQAHDLAYAEQLPRLVADQALQQCVAGTLPAFAQNPIVVTVVTGCSVVIGAGMFVAVRLFGGHFYRRAAP